MIAFKILFGIAALACLYLGINIALAATPMMGPVDVMKYTIGLLMEFFGLVLLMVAAQIR